MRTARALTVSRSMLCFGGGCTWSQGGTWSKGDVPSLGGLYLVRGGGVPGQGLYLVVPDFSSEMNRSLIKDAFFKPCFDTQPMAFPSELSHSPVTPYRPSPWPSTTQHLCQHLCLCLHLLFHQNNPSTMQYNWLESETQCALMHSVLNSLRYHLWFNRLKDTETWSWNIMLRITYLSSSLSSLYTTLLTSPPPLSPPLLPSPL